MQFRMPTRERPSRGFTLIEVMITVAIVAILSALAYPNYIAYIQRGKIIDGTTKLSDYKVRMDQYFMDNRTYIGGGPPGNCGAVFTPAPASDKFTINFCNATATTFVARAQGTGDLSGMIYQIDQTGAHTTLVPMPPGWNSANHLSCWITKQSGDC